MRSSLDMCTIGNNRYYVPRVFKRTAWSPTSYRIRKVPCQSWAKFLAYPSFIQYLHLRLTRFLQILIHPFTFSLVLTLNLVPPPSGFRLLTLHIQYR